MRSVAGTSRSDRGNRPRLVALDRFEDLAAVKPLERCEKSDNLAGRQQVLGSGGPPPEGLLPLEEGLHQQDPARSHQGLDVFHAGAVKIVEQQNHIKSPEIGPFAGEIHGAEINCDTEPFGGLPSRLQLRFSDVHRDDSGTPLGRAQGVPPIATGQVEHPDARTKEVTVPGEPRTGPLEVEHGRGSTARDLWHRASLHELVRTPADLLVIGGGITGCGIAREAAMRGLRTVLVEQGDLGAGTSSRSSRLIHGGLRYLETGRLRLVFEALRERRVLLRIAPHLVRPLPFTFPVHRQDRVPLWKLWAGVWLYDLLAAFRNVRWHRALGKRSLLQREPGVRERGLVGGVRYWDAQCDDARLVVATARSAQQHGALVANHMAVKALVHTDGKVRGARVRDVLTGEEGMLHAAVVVNATGPWADRLRRMEDPATAPLLRVTRGSHVLVPRSRIGHEDAITLTSAVDGRVMFVLPWGEFSYIGTTDTDCQDDPDEVRTTAGDVLYLLRSANAAFPNAHLDQADVRSTWAALRPLMQPHEALDPSEVSREHVIVAGLGGMLTIAGGKLTTYRVMATDMVDRVTRMLHELDGRLRPGRAPTDVEALPGGEVTDLGPMEQAGLDLGLPLAAVVHILRTFGTEGAAVFNLIRERRELARPLVPDHAATEAEVIQVARRELASRVDDVLVRRLKVAYEALDHGCSAARRTAELMGEVLGWDEARIAAEAARYENAISDLLPNRA